MNIYQHLFFIIPIVLLLLWSYIGHKIVNPYHWVFFTVIVSTTFGVTASVLYLGRILIPVLFNFYFEIGQY